MLANIERARCIMRENNLDALVAILPHHVYYLSDHWCSMLDARWQALYAAVLPVREDLPATLVLPSLGALELAKSPTWMPSVIPVTAPVETIDPVSSEPSAAPLPMFHAPEGVTLSRNDQRKRTQMSALSGKVAATAQLALRRALIDAGAAQGRVGFDDYRVPIWAASAGMLDATFVPAGRIFQEIRLVKTPAEVELLRNAARMNETSAMVAVHAVREGMSGAELECIYMAEMARAGAQGVFLTSSLGLMPFDTCTAGVPLMIDALGRYRQYHGDLGRTVVIGKPSKDLVRRNQAMKRAWFAALEMIRPGVKYSDIIRTVSNAAAKAGMPELWPCNPHNLGLAHTDDPAAEGAPPGVKDDLTLQEGMVMNVDIPYEEYGSGTVHTEDTVLVTRGGCESLTSNRVDLIIID